MAKKRRIKARVEKETKEVKLGKNKEDDDKLFAFIATFFSIIGFVIVILAKKKSEYVKYYAKQSLVVFIASVILSIISAIFSFIPVLGTVIKVGVGIITFILWLVSWVYALSGEEKEVPLVGHYAEKIDW